MAKQVFVVVFDRTRQNGNLELYVVPTIKAARMAAIAMVMRSVAEYSETDNSILDSSIEMIRLAKAGKYEKALEHVAEATRQDTDPDAPDGPTIERVVLDDEKGANSFMQYHIQQVLEGLQDLHQDEDSP